MATELNIQVSHFDATHHISDDCGPSRTQGSIIETMLLELLVSGGAFTGCCSLQIILVIPYELFCGVGPSGGGTAQDSLMTDSVFTIVDDSASFIYLSIY